jgi:hypothetical protein
LEAASFLTDDEKRAAAGYAAKDQGPVTAKYNDNHDELGLFSTADNAVPPKGGGGASHNDRLAMARLVQGLGAMLRAAPKVLRSAEKPLHDILKPGGKEIGAIGKGAGPGIRTVTKKEFDSLKAEALDGAVQIPAPTGVNAKWYLRPDGSKLAIRRSPRHGETLEVVESSNKSLLKNGYKVHFK